MVRWVIGSILHGGPIELFLDPASAPRLCVTKDVVCVIPSVYIKEPFLLIGKNSPWGGSGFSLSLSEWSFTICLTPYTCVVSLNKTFPSFLLLNINVFNRF